ncbi:MAG: CPBP family intramembrane glutamic endopeptidase [Patescibacteria group bacterium]
MEGLSRYGVPPSIASEKFAGFGIPPMLLILIAGLVAGPTINALFAFGEELGWRGFLQKELAYLGFWKSSFLIGLIWGMWHIPLVIQGYNYPQHPFIGIGMVIIFAILLSPLFNYIRIKSNSVIAVAIMHGTLNAVAGISAAFVKGGSDLTVGIQGVSGFIILITINVMLIKIISTNRDDMI